MRHPVSLHSMSLLQNWPSHTQVCLLSVAAQTQVPMQFTGPQAWSPYRGPLAGLQADRTIACAGGRA